MCSEIRCKQINMSEVHNFACCFDTNIKASKIINTVYLVIEGIVFIAALIIGLLPHVVSVCIKKYLVLSIFILVYFFRVVRMWDVNLPFRVAGIG